MAHITQVRVRWDETDQAQIVHFAKYFHWFEVAEVEFFRSCGTSRRELARAAGVGFPRIRCQCEYFSPAYEDDLLEVHTTVAEVTKKTYRLRFEVRRPADGAHLATGELTICCVRVKDGRMLSAPLPAAMVEHLRRATA